MTHSADQAQQRREVVAEALTWLGTPYHHHGRIKGVGVDCAQILCHVFEACGLVAHVDPGFYAHDHHLHRSEEIYIQWLQRVGAVEVNAPALGDVALFRWGRTWSHGGIVVGEDLVLHSYLGRGVYLTRFCEAPLDGRVPRFWSLFGKQIK